MSHWKTGLLIGSKTEVRWSWFIGQDKRLFGSSIDRRQFLSRYYHRYWSLRFKFRLTTLSYLSMSYCRNLKWTKTFKKNINTDSLCKCKKWMVKYTVANLLLITWQEKNVGKLSLKTFFCNESQWIGNWWVVLKKLQTWKAEENLESEIGKPKKGESMGRVPR